MEKNRAKADIYYRRNDIRKDIVISRLRERGCRITKQRQLLLDVILEEECASCKEMYYKACAVDDSIGIATVYRMVSILEDIGAFSRKNMYKISCGMNCDRENVCTIEFDDHTYCQLNAKNWYKVISEGLRVCGYYQGKKISSVEVDSCSRTCG